MAEIVPWVCAASAVSLCVTWNTPGKAYTPWVTYVVEQCIVEAGVSPGDWRFTAVAEAHTGHTPAHVVRGLITGSTYAFRVRLQANCALQCSLQKHCIAPSQPSRPFTVDVPFWCCYSPVHTWDNPAPRDCFSDNEMKFFRTLDTPNKVQNWIDLLPMNHELVDDTCLSPLEALRQNQCHCIEGAMLAAFVLSLHGYPALMMDMRACSADDDHNITPFQVNGLWGCISKSNHSSLRWRNPVYRTLREMMMTYWDDYMNGEGERTLRAYSVPVDLKATFGEDWAIRRGNVFDIAEHMDIVPHKRLVEHSSVAVCRPADEFMLKTTVNQREWPEPVNVDAEVVERNKNK